MTTVVLVPGVLALLPEYAGLTDPIADLRAACLGAVGDLGADVSVLAATDSGARVARYLLDATSASRSGNEASYIVVGNGSATRTEKAPGHLHPGAIGFDEALGAALTAPDAEALRRLDLTLGVELWADVGDFAALADLLSAAGPATVHYSDAPYGVQYWVLTWRTRR